jgi:hypothetical protein
MMLINLFALAGFDATTLIIMTFSRMTFCICDAQHKGLNSSTQYNVMMIVATLIVMTNSVVLNDTVTIVRLSVIVLNVVMMIVIMLSVMAPFFPLKRTNQLPVSVARWQHWSRIPPSSLFAVKINKHINSLTTDIFKVKTKDTPGIHKIFEKTLVYV